MLCSQVDTANGEQALCSIQHRQKLPYIEEMVSGGARPGQISEGKDVSACNCDHPKRIRFCHNLTG